MDSNQIVSSINDIYEHQITKLKIYLVIIQNMNQAAYQHNDDNVR